MTPRRTPAVSPLPAWAGGLGALALCFLLLPLAFMLGRVNWTTLAHTLATEAALSALGLSLSTCTLALCIDLILGVPAANLLSRTWRGVRAARILVALPLSLPPVVAGIALLAAFGRRSTLGSLLSGTGLDIAFTTSAVVIAQVFVSLPFLIVTLESALRSRKQGIDDMAASLGASPTRVFWQITLPAVLPGLGRGTALALARCLGEFGATLTFAGSMQGVTRTMPLQIYLARESDADLALALGIVLLGVAALVVALTETPWAQATRLIRPTTPQQTHDNPRPTPHPTPHPTRPGQSTPVTVDGTIRQRGWHAQVRLRPGLVTAVVGHNGAGKSTLAQIIAGTLRLDSGTVTLGERTLDDATTFVPARKRGVALVSQEPHIFTHMSVLANVAFPLRARGVAPREARDTALEQLRAVGIADLANRRACDLSGGQAARVAIARALAFPPDILILDEPTAALDVEATSQVSTVLRERLRGAGITTLLVSHDIAEVLSLASHMIVMGNGRVVEEGTPASILSSPSSTFAARLAGLNIVTGQATEKQGMIGVRVGDNTLWAALQTDEDNPTQLTGHTSHKNANTENGARIALTFPPEAVALSRDKTHASPRSVLPGTISAIDVAGNLVNVRVILASATTITARVTASAWAELGLETQDSLWVSVKATQVRAIPIAQEP